jgi:nucleoid-associated protein YgaU
MVNVIENVYQKQAANMKAVKAKITILDGPHARDEIEVMFNPSEYSVASIAQLDEKNKKDITFKSVNIEDFTVKLIFDTYEKHKDNESGKDVRKVTEKITRIMMPFKEGKKGKRPPVCLFSWGKFAYKGIISKIDQKFILFLPDGTPVREELTVIFKSVMTAEEYAKNMGIEACRKVWTVKSGDRLDLIADSELKDASLWRRIADENQIDDPLKFPMDDDIGRRIIIPD